MLTDCLCLPRQILKPEPFRSTIHLFLITMCKKGST